MFDRNALMQEIKESSVKMDGEDKDMGEISTFGDPDADDVEESLKKGRFSPEKFNSIMNDAIGDDGSVLNDASTPADVRYADQLMPFNITVNFLNEMGNKAKLTIYGVEILNEGMGFSIQDLSTNMQYSFVATDIEELTTV